MDYYIDWLVPDRVIYTRVSGDISLEEAFAFFEQTNAWRQLGSAPVHTVGDWRGVTRYPTNVPQVIRKARRERQKLAQSGQIIMITTSGIMLSLMSMARSLHLMTADFTFVRTFDEGVKHLQQREPSLAALLAGVTIPPFPERT